MATNGTTNTNTSGEESVAFNFVKKGSSDCISDKNMAEIARRIIGAVSRDELGEVVFAPEPPNNGKKIWIQTSPAGGIIGTIKRFDSATSTWVDDHTPIPDTPDIPIPQTASDVVPDSGSAATFTHVFNHNLGTSDYIYTITPTSQPDAATVWWENTKDTNNLSIDFNNANGVTFRIDILEFFVAAGP